MEAESQKFYHSNTYFQTFKIFLVVNFGFAMPLTLDERMSSVLPTMTAHS
jgi:hypothetical protein